MFNSQILLFGIDKLLTWKQAESEKGKFYKMKNGYGWV